MTTLNLSLPKAMRSFIEKRVSEGEYSTASEYIRELVRKDQKRKADDLLEALLLEGLDSGKLIEVTDQWMKRRTAELLARYPKRRRGRKLEASARAQGRSRS